MAAQYHRRNVRLQALAVLLAVLVVGWLAWRVLAGPGEPVVDPVGNNGTGEPAADAEHEPVRSAEGGFSMVVPDGWQGILRMQGADWFILSGEAQPQTIPGAPANVEDADMVNSGPYVFQAQLGTGFGEPKGEAIDFIAGSGDKHLSGKRYLWDAALSPSDPPDMGTKIYTYVFALGGDRQLRVSYVVHESDPRDMVVEVDKVVRSIKVLK